MLQAIDGWIITKFEAFSHWTQRNFGITSGRWAQLFVLLAALMMIRRIAMAGWGMRIMEFLVMLEFLGRFLWQGSRTNAPMSDKATMNPQKLIYGVRVAGVIGILMFLPLDVMSINFWFEASVIGMYFQACDDLPYSKSRLGQWLESLMPAPTQEPVEVGQ